MSSQLHPLVLAPAITLSLLASHEGLLFHLPSLPCFLPSTLNMVATVTLLKYKSLEHQRFPGQARMVPVCYVALHDLSLFSGFAWMGFMAIHSITPALMFLASPSSHQGSFYPNGFTDHSVRVEARCSPQTIQFKATISPLPSSSKPLQSLPTTSLPPCFC